MSVGKWYEDHRNLAILARHMIEESDTAEDILYMLEKPWKYEAEFQGALALNDVALIVDTQ